MSTPHGTLRKSKLSYTNISADQQELITALYEGDCLAIAPVGYGKAVCGQTAAQELIQDGHVDRVLIVAPLKVCELTWRSEWRSWEHLRPVAMATGTPKQRKAALESGAPIVVLNFDNLVWFFKEYPQGLDFDGILYDELSKLKTAGSKMVQKVRRKLANFTWRAGMSATPVAESGIDIYSQALVIDGGKALGTRLDKFKRLYCMQMDYKGYKWELQPGAAPRLAEALKPILFTADSRAYEESLPTLADTKKFVPMPDDGWFFYNQMRDEMMLEIQGTEVEAPNAGVMIGKLQQIVQGFVYRMGGDKRYAASIHTAKFEALEEILQDKRPTIVSYQFQWEQDMLRGRFPNMAFLADHPAKWEEQWNVGLLDALAVHPQSAGHGLNLQKCPGGNRLVCMSPIWSADLWRQLLGRLRRRGQAESVVERITLVTPGTVDDIVMDRLRGKAFAEADLMTHLMNV